MLGTGAPGRYSPDRGTMDDVRRTLLSLSAALGAVVVLLASSPPSGAVTPWFDAQVGTATQVLSVVGTGGSLGKMDVWQRGPAGWQPVGTGIGVHLGSAGLAPEARDSVPATPMGV